MKTRSTTVNQKGNILPVLLALLLAVFAVWIFFYVRDHRHDQGSSAATSSQASSAKLSNGTDDSSLNSDLQNINSGLSQGNQELQNSNDALNDQQLPVTE